MEIKSLNKIVFFALMLGITSIGYSQGGWDLYYLPIDSLKTSLIGEEIRLDFKSYDEDTINGIVGLHIRKLLSTKDTVNIIIDGVQQRYYENWVFYVDHGVLSDQFLKEIKGNTTIIEIILLDYNNSTLTLNMSFYQHLENNPTKKLLKENKIISLNRSILKGVLIRRYYD